MNRDLVSSLLKLISVLSLLASITIDWHPSVEGATLEKPMVGNGQAIYLKHCVWCHGREGRGDGSAAGYLAVKPTDFTQGVFKIRSTRVGDSPTDKDLVDTLRFGLPGSAMPGYKNVLSQDDMAGVVDYLKSQFIRQQNNHQASYSLTFWELVRFRPPSEKSVERGSVLFQRAKCAACHGQEGRGDGDLTLKDRYGRLILPADLTQPWNFRGSRGDPYNPVNVYRTLSTGMDGTQMPSYAESLSKDERWDLSDFVLSLGPRDKINPESGKPELQFILKSKLVHGAELPAKVNAPQWQSSQPLQVAMVPALYEEPRHFLNPIQVVEVRSLHTDREIAFLFEWHDRTKSRVNDKRKPFYDARALNVSAEQHIKDIANDHPFNDAIAIQFPENMPTFIRSERQRLDQAGRFFEDARIPHRTPRELVDYLKKAPPGDAEQRKRLSEALRIIKPFVLYGDRKHGADIWKWEADSSVRIINAHGIKQRTDRKERPIQLVDSSHKNGKWQVLIKRDFKNPAEDNFQLPLMQYVPVAFFVWDGDAGEVDEQMAHSAYYYLILESDRLEDRGYTSLFTHVDEPIQMRTVHPVPPRMIDLNGRQMLLKETKNPDSVDEEGRSLKGREKQYRTTWFNGSSQFSQNVREGAALYFGKGGCFFCHGPLLNGNGIHAWALNPRPSNFLDEGQIAQLPESYVFWRVAKGGRDLPEEAFPWESSMPPTEDQLSEHEIWNTILFLYVASGYFPQPSP